jgi:YHS domain-containing protein
MVQCADCGADIHKEAEPKQAECEGEPYHFDSTNCQERCEESPPTSSPEPRPEPAQGTTPTVSSVPKVR